MKMKLTKAFRKLPHRVGYFLLEGKAVRCCNAVNIEAVLVSVWPSVVSIDQSGFIMKYHKLSGLKRISILMGGNIAGKQL